MGPLPVLARAIAVPWAASATCFAIILGAMWLAGYVPEAWQGNWTDHIVARQAHVVDRFFPFDAVWYQRIADTGYAWDPARPDLKQDVAFFPVWPLAVRLVSALVGTAASRWCVVGLAALCAVASVCAFHRLARRLLPGPTAAVATWLFALYPGASFLLLSYPTGLMNLLCILAVLAVMDGRFWRAALLSGVVTGVGPLGLGTALMVMTSAAPRVLAGRRAAGGVAGGLAGWLALGAVSVSGLLLFLAWQFFAVGDAFAFMKAQQAWQVSPPLAKRVPRAFWQLLIVPDFLAAAREFLRALSAGGRIAVQAGLEKSLYLAAEGAELIALLACRRLPSSPLLLQGGWTMALFVWFHGTVRPGNSTLRLTYCILGVFFGAAMVLRGRPRLALGTVIVSGLLLAGGAFLSASGYAVV
jgi:hypothetical protein